MSEDRLQKIIARAGVTSRRKAEDYITAGRVAVNGEVVTELGAKADPQRDTIEVDGQPIELPDTWTYIVLNKPAGLVTTASDEFDRDTVIDALGDLDARVYPVGRLDLDAEGLLLLTNDGDLAAALTHPAGEVPKTYRTKVRGRCDEDTMTRLLLGVELDDGPAAATYVQRADVGRRPARSNTWIDLTVTEGRNHLVKRMCAAIGHPVVRLRRIAFANLTLHGLRPGEWRPLTPEELRHLRAIAAEARKRRGGGRGQKAGPTGRGGRPRKKSPTKG